MACRFIDLFICSLGSNCTHMDFYVHGFWAALGRTPGIETIYEIPKVLVKADEEQVQLSTV